MKKYTKANRRTMVIEVFCAIDTPTMTAKEVIKKKPEIVNSAGGYAISRSISALAEAKVACA